MFKKALVITLAFFLTSFSSVHTLVQTTTKDKMKQLYVIIVQSYNVNHICGTPQEIGFLKALEEITKDKYKLKVETYYLNGKNKTNIELELAGKKISKKIQVKNPDIVVSFDDMSLQYVLSKQELVDYPKFSSGINKLVTEYTREGFILTNFCGIIEEEVNFEKLKQLLQKNYILKSKKIHVLVDISEVSKQLLRDFRKSFNDNEFQLIEINNLNQLNGYFRKLNHKKDVIVNLLQTIEDGNEYMLKDKIIYYISIMHPNFIQITTNKSSINFGADIVVGIDFELMGYMLQSSLKEYIYNRNCKGIIMKALNDLYVNYKSIEIGKFDFSKDESDIFKVVK